MKRCSGCKQTLPRSAFNLNASRGDGLKNYCRSCERANAQVYRKNRRLREPSFQQDAVRKTRFGISRKEFDERVLDQKGVCAICKQPPTRLNSQKECRTLEVDHDHKTGYNRALLCSRCNLMLGNAMESPEILIAGAQYLEDWDEGP